MRTLTTIMMLCALAACTAAGTRETEGAAVSGEGQPGGAPPVDAAEADRAGSGEAPDSAKPDVPEAGRAGPEEAPDSAAPAGDVPDPATGHAPDDAGHTHGDGQAPAPLPAIARLAPGEARDGIRRAEPVVLREGMDHEDPAVVVTPGGRVVIAVVSRDGARERIWVREGDAAGADLGPARRVTAGARAWRPALAAGADGAVWLAWCGRDRAGARDDHRREVRLLRLDRPKTKAVAVSTGAGRNCDPALAVAADGTVHVAWEAGERIAWRSFDAAGRPRGAAEIVSAGPFDRRPSVAVADGQVHVAWDSLVDTQPTGAEEPDYDVRLRSRTGAGWGDTLDVDARAGIQAAPALAAAPGGGVLVAYHSSHRHPLVKHWQVRRMRSGTIETLAVDPVPAVEPAGEQQGAELPALAVSADGRIALATRPSQGAYVHVLDGGGLTEVDLTRRGWGARGLHLGAAFATDGSLLVVRRARHEAVLERLTFEQAPAGSAAAGAPVQPGAAAGTPVQPGADVAGTPVQPDADIAGTPVQPGADVAGTPVQPDVDVAQVRFAPVRDPAKPARPPLERAPAASDLIPNGRVLLGDVHMHSAASDATGPVDEIYARAWVRGLDFAVLTDHDYIVGSRMALSEHDEIAWVTDVFDRRDGFTTLHAYEWTTPPLPSGFGHRNVYFRGHAPTPVPGFRDGAPGTGALWSALKDERAFAAPHHTTWTGTDWDKHDPALQRHVEVVSVHGAAERPGDPDIAPRGEKAGMFAVDGLELGLRFGFLGGSDAHGLLWHHGLGRRRDPWVHGLTGVVAPGADRAALWDALYARRTFATSGLPMELQVSAGGVAMGGEGTSGPEVEVRWSARGTAPLTRLDIVRDGETVHQLTPSGLAAAGRWVDRGLPPGPHYWYVRAVQQTEDRTADVVWSSPLFLDVRPTR